MTFYNAKVADILRSSQRDTLFVNNLQDDLQTFFKHIGPKNYNLRNRSAIIANAWYYFITSLGNIQTLGEEYTGTIRVDGKNVIPGTLTQIIWLILYIGGEPLLDRLISKSKNKVEHSKSLTTDAKTAFLNILKFISSNKGNFYRIHKSLFYISGKYYNVSNRVTGIKYLLVRPWLQDDSFTKSFKFLGYLSLFYTLFNGAVDMMSSNFYNTTENSNTNAAKSSKYCVLCSENLKFASATSCGHIFCWSCIYDSLSYQKNCPICREAISFSRIYFLQNYV